MVAFFGPHTFVITSFSFLEVVVLCIGNPFFNNYIFITQHHYTILCESLVLRFFFISLTYTSHTTASWQLKNSMMFGGFIEILRTFAVVQKLKKAMKGLDLKTVLAAVALLGTVCNAASQEKADGRGALAAPQVEVDANGLFTVEDCPTVYDRFNIVFHVSDYVISSADILWDGVECQTVSFDNDNDKIGTKIGELTIKDDSEIYDFCAENKIEVVILCIPKENVENVLDKLYGLGIRNFWNFSHYDITSRYNDAVVENVHLNDSLMTLCYRISNS